MGAAHPSSGTHTHRYPNGDEYAGGWAGGQRSGHGVYSSSSGHRFEGDWVDDKREGYGVLTFTQTLPDGSSSWAGTYEGEWVNNLKSGRGTYAYATGDKYAGQWFEGEKLLGIYFYANKDRYSGDFRRGVMHGQGLYTFSSGDEVVGRWQDDAQDGISVHTTAADGSLREEVWEAGERMSSRPIGSADPLAISAGLDADRIRRKCAVDTAQFHLTRKAVASASFDTVSPAIAPSPRTGPAAANAAEMLEQLSRMQALSAEHAAHPPVDSPSPDAVASAADTPDTIAASSNSDNLGPAPSAAQQLRARAPSAATAAAHLAQHQQLDELPAHAADTDTQLSEEALH